MINIKKILKGLRILNENDQSKSLELSVSNSATTNTKTTITAAQTANRTITLPDATTTISGNDTPADLTNKTVSLSNTTDNKLLVSEATTHKIVDSTLTHINNSGNTELSASGNVTLTVPSNKEIIFQGKSFRVPVVAFPVLTPPTGNVGNLLFNTTTQSLWFYQSTGYVELISDAGANKTLTNLIAPVSANQDINPDTDGRDLGTSLLRWDLFAKDVEANNVETVDLTATGTTVVDDLTVNGQLTLQGSIDRILQNDLEVNDKQITINKGGTDVTSVDAGIIVERTTTDAHIFFDNSLASKFKIGLSGSESEVITATNSQTMTGDKTFSGQLNVNSKLNLAASIDTSTNSDLDLSARKPIISLFAPIGSKTPITSVSNATNGQTQIIFNESGDPVEFVNGGTINTGEFSSITVNPNESVFTYVKGSILHVLPTVKQPIQIRTPNVIRYNTAGSFTYTPSAGVEYIRVKMVGAGAAGGTSGATGANGGLSSFTDDVTPRAITAEGGLGGTSSVHARAVFMGGLGGSVSFSGAFSDWELVHSVKGGDGDNGYGANTFNAFDGVAGNGGNSFLGGGGRGGATDPLIAGRPGAANSGAGGGGINTTLVSGLAYHGAGGGGAGAYAEFIIPKAFISTSYALVVGAGGAGISDAGSGADGLIIIEEI